MKIFKVPTGLLRSSTWAFLLVYVVLLLPRPSLTDTGDIINSGKILTNGKERGGVESESLTNDVLIDEQESGQALDMLPIVTTPPTNEPLLEEPPRSVPPVEQDLHEREGSLNGGIAESNSDHMTSHDHKINGSQNHSASNDRDEIIPSIQAENRAALSLDNRGSDTDNIPTDTPPYDGGGILMDGDATLSHDQGVDSHEVIETKIDVNANEEEAIKKIEENPQLPLPDSSQEERDVMSHDEKVVVDAEQESPPQVRQCGELDLDCRQTDKAVKTDEEMEAIQNGVVEMEAGKEEEDDVPSFEEFKQKMIEQGAGQQRVFDELNSLHLSTQNQNKNFASLDCGAKVIETNPGAQNPSSILDENRDKYMINSCSSKIWFIVQLCELVSVRSLEIASFELFSSTPQSFDVYCAERYPTDNWFRLGTFLARNERTVQSFPLITDENVYANYIKVEMVSHYGDERYCPISLFRVLGASMIEVFEESEQNAHSASSPTQPSVVLPPSEGMGEDELFWEVPDGKEETKNGTLLHRAKDAVLRVINKINDFIHPDDDQDQDGHSQHPSTSTRDSEETNVTNTNTTVKGDSEMSEGCGLGDEGCVKGEVTEESGLNGKMQGQDKNSEELLNTRVEDTAGKIQGADQDIMVDDHHHDNSIEESRPISESTASLDTDQPLHQPAQVSTAPIQPSPSKPVEDDSISVTSQSSEVKQLSTGEAIYEGSVSVDAEEGTGERETLQFEKNVEQEVTAPTINPSPSHVVTDSPSADDTSADIQSHDPTTAQHSDQQQHQHQDDILSGSLPQLPPSSNKTDNNEHIDAEPESIHTASTSSQEETIKAPVLGNNPQEHLKIDPSYTNRETELKSEVKEGTHNDDIRVTHSPLGPETLPLSLSTVAGENKGTPSLDETTLGPPILIASEQPPNDIPTQNTDTSKTEATLPSATVSQPYASVSESSTINQDSQNSVSGDNDQTSDYANDRPDLSGQAADGSLLTPAQNTTGSHINSSEVINASLVSDDGQIEDSTISGGQEFEMSSLEFGGSNATVNEQSTHPHIPSAAVVNSSKTEDGIANATGHSDGWNASHITENNDATNANNSSMNIVEPQELRQETLNAQNSSVGVSSSNKSNVSLSASEGGSGPPLPPSHGGNGNGAPYLGSLPPREKEKSVFLRLSNHIKELEVNMSIFSSYLDQISTSLKRNKNRTEEATRALDKKINSLNDSLVLLKDETSVHLHSLHELNQELQQLTSAMGDLTTGLDSLSHDIFSQQNLLAIANMVAIVSLSLLLGVWYSCSQRKVRRDLAELKTLMVNMKSETSSGESSTNDFASSLSLATGQVLRNSHVRSSSASELNDLKSVRGIGELSQRHLRGFNIGGASRCHGDEVHGGMNGLSSHSLSSLDDCRETGSEMWKVIDSRRKKKTKSKQKT